MKKLKKIEFTNNLKSGDILVYVGHNEFNLRHFTRGKEYRIEGFYSYSYGVVFTNDKGDLSEVCMDNVKTYFKMYPEEPEEDVNKDSTEDRVNHPSHYTWLKDKCGIEVIDITRHMDFCLGNAIKYVLRAGHKKDASLSDNQKEVEDLKKAIFYINDKIAQIEGKYDKDK